MTTTALQEIDVASPRRKWPRYPSYRSVGIDWCLDFPKHWSMSRLKYLAAIRAGENITALMFDDDGKYPVYGGNGVRGHATRFSHNGDFVLIGRQGALCGNVHRVRGKFWASEHAAVATCRVNVSVDWFAYLVETMNLKRHSETAAQPGLALERVARLPVPVPPLDEQQAIAAFLDRETTRIDELIAKKQRLIELLKEKRQAVISHAVTQGLNPDAPMKPSGIDWLGEIPAHWTLTRFGNVSSVVRGASPRPAGDSRFFYGSYIPWITVAEVTKDEAKFLLETESMLTKEGASRSRLLHTGTLVVTNSGATLGVPKILRLDGCANDGIVAFLNLSSEANREFLYYYLCSLTMMYRERIKQGSGQPNLNTSIVRATALPLPPVTEQEQVVESIEKRLNQLDSLLIGNQKGIATFSVYRSALITAAVTGQIDVRNYHKEAACP